MFYSPRCHFGWANLTFSKIKINAENNRIKFEALHNICWLQIMSLLQRYILMTQILNLVKRLKETQNLSLSQIVVDQEDNILTKCIISSLRHQLM